MSSAQPQKGVDETTAHPEDYLCTVVRTSTNPKSMKSLRPNPDDYCCTVGKDIGNPKTMKPLRRILTIIVVLL